MSFIPFLSIGFVVGLVAGKLVIGHGFGAIGDILVGMFGALIGVVSFSSLNFHSASPWGSVLMAFGGALILLLFTDLVWYFVDRVGPRGPIERS